MKTTITSIAAINIKGHSFRQTILPLTCISGDNATGKTAITDAIQIALLGYLPALGKKPSSTMALAPAGAKQMEVEAEFSTLTKIRRTFTRTRTGAGVDHNGYQPAIAPAALTFAEFINAKPTERHEILSSLMGQIDYAELADRTKAEMAKLGLMDHITVKIDPQAEKPLDDAIAGIGEQGKELKQTVDQARKTLASMAMADEPSAIPRDQVEKANADLAAANEAVGKAAQALDSLDEIAQRAPSEPNQPCPTDDDHLHWVTEKSRTAKELAEVLAKQANRAELVALREQLKADEAKLFLTAKDTPPVKPQDSQAETEAMLERIAKQLVETDEASARFADLNGQAKNQIQSIDRQLAQLDKGKCPCCGSEGAALEEAMRNLTAAKETAAIAGSEVLVDFEKTFKKKRMLREEETRLRQNLKQIAAWEASEEMLALKQRVETLETSLKGIPDPHDHQVKAGIAETTLAKIDEAREEWQAYRAAKVPTPDELAAAREALKDAKESRAAAFEELSRIRAAGATHDAWLSDRNRMIAMQDEATKNEATLKATLQLRTFLQEEQRSAVAESMKPLIETAGIFLKGLVAGEMTTDKHLVGITRDGNFLPLEVLSGMEMVAVSAACQAALASQGEIKLLLVDELARLTPKNQLQFFENCHTAIERGVIDQAILICQSAPDSRLDIYTILV